MPRKLYPETKRLVVFMKPRLWIALAGLSGALSVIAGAVGAHKLHGALSPVATRIFDTAQLYHALHTLALLGVGILLLTSEGRRAAWAGLLLQLAALAFVIGIICFSGGIYVQLGRALNSSGGVVPAGGMAFIAGWVLLAVAAFGLRR
jgi:uncharacterized membrane protein YgdD (TMEM256/DUF423 family)